MDTDLTAFGYVGDLSDLIIDLFTGCMFTEQDQRREALLRRGIEWNEYWEGDRLKLPEGAGNIFCPYVDRYLTAEYTRYIEAWLETDAPAKEGDFCRAKGAIDAYFSEGHFSRDIEYYASEGFMPLTGRQKFIFQVALAWLSQRSQQKNPELLGASGNQVRILADTLNKERASAAHSPSRSSWGLGR